MFWNVLAIVYGVFMAVYPKKAIDYLTRIVLVGYENPEDLEPSEWYVSLARTEGLLLAIAGVVSLVVSLVVSESDSEKEAVEE